MKVNVKFNLNGQQVELETEAGRTLLEVLRNEFNLTGTKKGCGEGDCGACTVLLDEKAVNSCLTLIPKVNGCNVTTIEGVGEDGLDPIQHSFVEHGGIQCGFCTPGMIMSTKALLNENPSPAEGEIRKNLAGNLCRCTGYAKIVDSIMKLSDK